LNHLRSPAALSFDHRRLLGSPAPVAKNQGSSTERNARDCKYAFNLWRPITAIREAETDGNLATEPDLNWTPLLPTPPFPEYTSGHSTFSGAAAVVLASFFGSDRIPFSVGSDDLPGIFRSYRSFSEAAIESGFSRIYAGIHFMSANVHGLATGAATGVYVMRHL
jgi:hypothetical protein